MLDQLKRSHVQYTALASKATALTNCIGTPRKYLHGGDTTGHDKLKGVVMIVKRVNGPQPGQNRTLVRV
jgi:hypothetical protein